MPVEHRVEQGECLSSIADSYGFSDYRTIYNHADNADFREKRPNPNVIMPGDVLTIPDITSKTVACETALRHVFTLKQAITKLRIVLASDSGELYCGKRYRLTVDGQDYEGKTDSEGLVEQTIPAGAKEAELVVFLSDSEEEEIEGYSLHLELGALDPPDYVSGAQARLINLGYECESVGGTLDAATQAAIEAFQEHNGLSVSGVLDDATVEKLRQLHEE